jgi:hypothetical protein
VDCSGAYLLCQGASSILVMFELTWRGYVPLAVIIRCSCNGDETSTCVGGNMLRLFERRRPRLNVAAAWRVTQPVLARCETALTSTESDHGEDLPMDHAPQKQVCLDAVDNALAAYQDGLAPAGATPEAGVDAAMAAASLTPTEADRHREVLIDLAHSFVQPGERILGVGLMPYFSPAEVVLVLTHGFAVKSRSRTYRVELDRETPSSAAQFGLHGLTLTTHASLGDLHYYDAVLLKPEGGRLPRFYLALRTQELNPARPAKPVSGSRCALRLKIAAPWWGTGQPTDP